MSYNKISGFSDEISPEIIAQFTVLNKLGIKYFEPRGINGKNISELDDSEVLALKETMKEYGISASSIGSPIGKIKTTDDFDAHFELFKRVVKTAQMLDCRYIRMFSFYNEQKNSDWTSDDREDVITKLKKMIDYAKAENVVLLHENEKDIYGDIGSRCKVILDELASPNFKAAFDFANFVQCGENTEECWELLKEHVAYIHIKDAVAGKNENVVCATGDGKIPEILKKAIREDGYEGFLTLEPHLVLFATLQSLEVVDATEVISENKAKDGAEGYAMQYNALKDVLAAI